jgi:hypothetical protein
MMQSTIDKMSLGERLTAPTPPFFKMLRKYALMVGAVAGTILTVGAMLPAVVVTVAGYLMTVSAVAVAVSQATVDADNLPVFHPTI